MFLKHLKYLEMGKWTRLFNALNINARTLKNTQKKTNLKSIGAGALVYTLRHECAIQNGFECINLAEN